MIGQIIGFLLFRPVLWFSPRHCPSPFIKIEMHSFSLPEFSDSALLYQGYKGSYFFQ